MAGVLSSLNNGRALKDFNLEELTALSAELRDEIITTVSRNGGHLAPSLGAVEISVAIHHVFETPRDKILWDVGHQAYVHKLLTGRAEQFSTLRRKGGLSGFPKRSESPHDMFGVGHASTAISAGLAFATARDAIGEDYSVLSVVGDGALTGGLSYEGLNNAGQGKTDFIVILNDNKMSISPNVGAIAKYLTQMTSGEYYNRFEDDLWSLLGKIPHGAKAQVLASRVKESLKQLIVPTILFEELGFRYFGPIDGHDLSLLISTLEAVRKIKGPVLIHTITKKGKGYRFAEQDGPRYHGVGKFDKSTGIKVVPPKIPSYTSVCGQTLCEMAEQDTTIQAITAAMPDGTGLVGFREKYPDRFFDVGIAEEHAVTFAAGLACNGLKPVVAIYSTFLQRSIDQIIHDAALQKLPVVFAVDRAGLVGEDGPTHHGVFDLTYLRMIPGMVVMAPKDENELRHMLATALAHQDGPVAVRYPRGAGVGVEMTNPLQPLPLGKAEVLQEGKDVCLLAVGSLVYPALEAAELLSRAGYSAQVVNMRFVKPLDTELLQKIWQQHSLVVTLEENSVAGGFGASILEWAATLAEMPRVRIINIGIPDEFQEHATRPELLAGVGLQAEPICKRLLDELDHHGHKNGAQSAS